jgi:hypothetical protein
VNIAAPVPTPKVVRGRMVLDVPGLRLVSLTNGSRWKPYATHAIRNHQHAEMGKHVGGRTLTNPLTLPVDVTIVRRAPALMDSDNAVAAGKYVRDWLANKWFHVNDRDESLVRYLYAQQKTSRKNDPPTVLYSVRIIVETRRAHAHGQ